MKKINIVYRPARIMCVIPILVAASYFDDKSIGFLFCLALSFFTFRIFPLSEIVEVKGNKEDERS